MYANLSANMQNSKLLGGGSMNVSELCVDWDASRKAHTPYCHRRERCAYRSLRKHRRTPLRNRFKKRCKA